MNKKNIYLISLFLIIFTVVYFAVSDSNNFRNRIRNVAAVAISNPNSVFLRTPSTGFCKITNATNSTPIKITVSNINDCGINTNGQIVIINEVRGNTSANIHLENSSDKANLARQVYNISGNTFDIKDLNDNPISGNGTYINGGRVGLATLYTLKSHPRIFLDGQGGKITSSISDKSANGRANSSSVVYKALKNSVDSFNSTYNQEWGSDRYGNMTAAASLRWLSDGDINSKNSAIFGLKNITQIIGTPACDETKRYCYVPASSVADYPTQFIESFMQAYSIMRNQLTASERENILNFLLSDLSWTEGGQDYTGVSREKPKFKVSDINTSGTVSISKGSNVLTGNGTKFLSTASAGDIIILPHSTENVYANGYLIKSVNSNTSLTLNTNIGESFNNAHYMIGPAWDNSKYGFLWFSKHFELSMLCGGAGDLLTGTLTNPYADCSSNYGATDGIYQAGGDNNLWLARLYGYYIIGLSTCGDDPRGCLLLSLANELFTNVALPRAMTIWTGFSQSNPGYHVGRMYNIVTGIGLATRNSFVEEPNYLSGTDIYEKGALWPIGAFMQNNTVAGGESFVPNSEQGTYYFSSNNLRSALLSMSAIPNSIEARQLKDWINKIGKYDESFIRYNKGEYVWWHFIWNDPSITTYNAPTTVLFDKTNYNRCVSIYGISKCPPDEGRYFATSNQDWTSNRTYLALNAISSKCLDHCSNDEVGGWFIISKKDKVLYSGDSNNFMGDRAKRPYLEVGGSVSTMKAYPDTGQVIVNSMSGDDSFMSANLDLKNIYKPSANVLSSNKQVFHLKSGTQDYIIDYVKTETSSQTSLKGIQMYHLNGCGTPNSSGCISLSRSNLTASNNQSGVKLMSKFIGIGGQITLQTDNNSDVNGSYQNGGGKAFKFYVCPSSGSSNCVNSNSIEYVAVHKPSVNSNDVLGSINLSVLGNFKVLEIKDNSPKVLLFTSGTILDIPQTFQTTYSGNGQILVSGIKSGVYKVLSGGQVVSGCSSIEVFSGKNTLNCDSVPSGEITITDSNKKVVETPLSISSVNVSDINSSSALINWTTNKNSNSRVEYGVSKNFGNLTAIYDNQIMTMNHSVSLTGLLPNTTYNFRVISKDSSSNYSTSTDYIFKTDKEANEVPIVYAGNNAVIDISDTLSTDATVIDDSPSNLLSYKWSVESGTGDVLFLNPESLNTKIRFTEQGNYKLLLDVSDGGFTTRDYIIVTVNKKAENITQNNQSNQSNNTNNSGNSTSNDSNNTNNSVQLTNNQNNVSSGSNDQFQNSNSNNSSNSSEGSIASNSQSSNSTLNSNSQNNNQQNSNSNNTGASNSNSNNNSNSSSNSDNNTQSSQSSSSGGGGGGGSPSNIGGGSDYIFSRDTNNVFTSNFTQNNNQNTQVVSSSNSGQTLSNLAINTSGQNTESQSKVSNVSSYSNTVSFGNKNSDVLNLQTVLNKQGLLSSSSKTGYFGNNTLQALKTFQLRNKLATVNSDNYGKVDAQTQKKIDELLRFNQSPKKTNSTQNTTVVNKNNVKSVKLIERDLKKDTEGDDVRNLQRVLVKEGLLKNSNVTGYFGGSTENAVKKFQVRYKILPSNTKSPNYGVVGPDTRKVVNEKLNSI